MNTDRHTTPQFFNKYFPKKEPDQVELEPLTAKLSLVETFGRQITKNLYQTAKDMNVENSVLINLGKLSKEEEPEDVV